MFYISCGQLQKEIGGRAEHWDDAGGLWEIKNKLVEA